MFAGACWHGVRTTNGGHPRAQTGLVHQAQPRREAVCEGQAPQGQQSVSGHSSNMKQSSALPGLALRSPALYCQPLLCPVDLQVMLCSAPAWLGPALPSSVSPYSSLVLLCLALLYLAHDMSQPQEHTISSMA